VRRLDAALVSGDTPPQRSCRAGDPGLTPLEVRRPNRRQRPIPR